MDSMELDTARQLVEQALKLDRRSARGLECKGLLLVAPCLRSDRRAQHSS